MPALLPRVVPGANGKRFDRRVLVIIAGALALISLPPFAHAIDQPFLVNLFTRIAIYAIAAVSLDLILGFGGMVSFGHAAWFGLGGYVVAIAAFHANDGSSFLGLPGSNAALIVWPLAIAIAALAALAIGALSLRTSGIHFIMITLAFAQMLFWLFVSVKTYGGDDGLALARRNALPLVDLRNATVFYYLCLACLAAWLALCQRIVDSRFGRVLAGIKQSERRMLALGYPVFRFKLVAFVIAASGAALAGVLWANSARFASPEMMAWAKSGEFMIMVILGGMGTLYGAVIGACVLLGLEHVLAAYTEHWMLVLGPLLVVFVLFAKRGLFGVLAGGHR